MCAGAAEQWPRVEATPPPPSRLPLMGAKLPSKSPRLLPGWMLVAGASDKMGISSLCNSLLIRSMLLLLLTLLLVTTIGVPPLVSHPPPPVAHHAPSLHRLLLIPLFLPSPLWLPRSLPIMTDATGMHKASSPHPLSLRRPNSKWSTACSISTITSALVRHTATKGKSSPIRCVGMWRPSGLTALTPKRALDFS